MVIGRLYEKQQMEQLLGSAQAEMLAITGRRRVGKTYLIKQVYEKHIAFDFIGTQHANRKNQLQKFADKITFYQKTGLPVKTPKDWAEAFNMLKVYLISLPKSKINRVVFFDELPWLAGHRSGFLEEFSYWWNDWASSQKLVVVISGSAASWMRQKITNDKGGLHNRITSRIHLQPFTLAETQLFLQHRKIHLESYEIIELYMTLGGIPHYLNEVNRGESAIQNINRLLLAKSGLLRTEFNNLYPALFTNPENHIAIIKALAKKHYGMNRRQLVKATGIKDGGGLTKVLMELEGSDFIIALQPFGKHKKDTIYRLNDEYSHFYLHFIEGKKPVQQTGLFTNIADERYKTWRGYAFENLCIKHIDAIKQALGIHGVQSSLCSFIHQGNQSEEGFQIDILIDRADNCINICEVKFVNDTLKTDAAMATLLRKKREQFRVLSTTKKHLFNTIISTYGVQTNEYSLSQVDQSITIEALFNISRF